MPINREVKIIKVPLSERERALDYPKSFQKMPRLYLELLENKAKIKQDLINKEYIPPQSENDKKEEIKEEKRDNEDSNDKQQDKKEENKEEKDNNDENSKSSSVSSRSSSLSESYSKNIEDNSEEEQDEINVSSRSDKDKDRDDEENDSDSDALSDRLKELLSDSSRSESKESFKQDKYSKNPKESHNKTSKYTPYDKYKSNFNEQNKVQPPTLAELEAKGHYQGKQELRNINHIPLNEYEEEDKKRELIFKFELLKKSYPLAGTTIPDYTIHSDLREMQKSYDSTVKRLSLDSSVESYKNYLIGGFMLVEFAFGNFLGFDMQGFTQQQILSMHSYEKLLIELGEKSYVPSGSKWPVEIRLLFVIITNAAVFIISKMIMRKTGANLLNMINTANMPSRNQGQQVPKRKMRGPNINLEDIPEAEEVSQK